MMLRAAPSHSHALRRALCALSTALLAISSNAIAQSTAQADAAVIALDQKNCEAATDALNKGMANNEPRSFFIAGQLFEYGVCLKVDPAKSASVCEREQRMTYPREAAVAGVTGKVRVRFDPRPGAATVVSSSDNTGLSMTHVGPNKRLLERALLAGYDDAIKTLPKPPMPDRGDFASERDIKFERNPNSAAGPYGLQQLRR